MKTTGIKIMVLLLLSCNLLKGQSLKFVTNGVVEYAKTVNMYAVLARTYSSSRGQEIIDRYKSNFPQFLTLKSTLSFSGSITFFQPTENSGVENPLADRVGQHNIVYNDLTQHQVVAQKDLLGEVYLLKDIARSIKWKITDETRDIAGYPCRRANAIIMDSVYVVAFFTTDIPVSGGPESFTGLPGMILQLSLPHENITWMATKVNDATIPEPKPPVKGKPTTNQALRAIVEPSIQRFGASKNEYLKALLL